ncbi:MAG: cytochrome c3 family protein [Proteobacteria bacterium]|nr:cytochrome c3 family protein [Pseudomonadota bacterium]MBU1640434.1 cytochrome c3 family protein [Pseudomonadota bacterium]
MLPLSVTLAGLLLLPEALWAGGYLDSAHGSSSAGVERSATTSFATGNCLHCHETHASVAGSEPAPTAGTPSAYTLFATNFNTSAVPGSYLVADNVCFYCHSASATAQVVVNGDYATTFGGDASGTLPQYIMEAFNQRSYHNLGDIHNFVDGESILFPWYSEYSNPCNACHNPHLAKRNYQDFSAPLSSAISKPTDHFNLWGQTELMSSYSSYEAPYANATSTAREPDGSTTADGSKTADYVGFCTNCHNTSNTIYSTTLARNLRSIDWSSSGDKHGGLVREGLLDSLNPYTAAAATKSNFLLSCLDCHEPHGSSNIMLLRKRVNGGDLSATITTTNVMGALCRQCHKDDAAASAGTNTVGKWQYIHHYSSDRPYSPTQCALCHGSGGSNPPPIPCGNCHFHGSDDSWAGARQTNRKTF